MTGKRPLVLIIDDDEHICYTFREICTYQGWEALSAYNYPQAQALLARHKPDIVLVDYHLPIMDGIRVVTALRQTHPRVPILVLTVEEQEHIMHRFLEAGADDFALKPIKALDLIARMKMHLKYAEQRQFYSEGQKGINPQAVERVLSYLRQLDGYADIETIAAQTEIGVKSIYRYMQHLVKNGEVITRNDHGKIGRPKTMYSIAKVQ